MSVRTRTRHIRGAYRKQSIPPEEKSVPWREAFKEGIEQFTEAGLVLAGSRLKEGLTQRELAEKLGVKPHHISEMEHGKRSIGKAMAHRLAKILKMNYRLFL
jgi:ribosome-binding protein aMBF1 (putative translation factor)